MTVPTSRAWSRRAFLQAGATAALAASVRPSSARAADDPYAGFKMGIQSYSLRGYKAPEALDHTKTLGLKYWEGYSGHIPQGRVPKHIEEQRALLVSRGVTMLAYGVVGFDADENKARAMFDFAKGMGLMSISADPAKDKATFDLLDKLVAEYDIAIAIHNHGPKHRYDKIADVEAMVKDRHPKIGACVDTGHYLRSSENPVDALERLKDRVFGVHLKDVKDAKVFKILGEGDLDLVGCLKMLEKIKYNYCLAIEYEENPMNPVPDLEVCLENVRKAMTKLG